MYFVKFCCCILYATILLSHTTGQQAFCGPALYDILDNICSDGYQKMLLPTKKRNALLPHLGLDDIIPKNAIIPYPYAGRSVFLDKIFGEIADLMAKTRRRRSGIYYECCNKGCTLKEITSYCSGSETNN